MALVTKLVTNGDVLLLGSQSNDLMPSLFKHQTGRRKTTAQTEPTEKL